MKGNSAPIQISVPVKPYLLKFIQYIEGLGEGDVFDLNRKSLISDTLRRMFKYKKACLSSSLRDGYSASFPVLVPPGIWNQGRFYLDQQAIHDFNTAVFYFFHEVLEFKLLEGTASGQERKQVIEDYMSLLGIDEDVDFDTVKKGNFRLRQPRPDRIEPRKKHGIFSKKQSFQATAL